MSRAKFACLATVFLWSLACTGARDPGPNEDEWGQVLFWEVTDLTSDSTACTDAEGFADALTLPPLEPSTFFMVRIAEDGSTATAVDCTETRAESCTDVDDIVFTIDGHVLEHAPPPQVVDADGGCEVALAQVWTMIDDGDLGALDVQLTFPFDGEGAACDALDAAIAAQGSNGDGLRDCEATLTADLAFVSAD